MSRVPEVIYSSHKRHPIEEEEHDIFPVPMSPRKQRPTSPVVSRNVQTSSLMRQKSPLRNVNGYAREKVVPVDNSRDFREVKDIQDMILEEQSRPINRRVRRYKQ